MVVTNGYSKKTLLSEDGRVEISIPRDWQGDFEPLMIAKGEKRFKEFDERIIDMYAGGMTIREIQTFLEEHYDIELSPDLVKQHFFCKIEKRGMKKFEVMV